jgi:mRNA interferase RelE/StbE
LNYEVRIGRDAERDIVRLPSAVVPRVVQAIRGLAIDPRPPGCKKLKGQREVSWRIRVGSYRIIYVIDDGIRIVEVREVGNRKDVYR